MKFLRRFTFSVFILLTVLLLLLPGSIGLLAERFHGDAIAQLNAEVKQFDIAVEDFERGWFSSEVRLMVQPAGGAQPWQYRGRLRHGPYPLSDPAWLGDQGELLDANEQVIGTLTWAIGLTTQLSAVAMVDWHPSPQQRLAADLDLSFDQSRDRLDLRLSDFNLIQPGLVITTAEVSSLLQANEQGIWTGPIEAKAGAIDAGLWSARSIAINNSIQYQDNAVGLVVDASAADLIADTDYHDNHLRFRIDKLHWPTLRALGDTLRRSWSSGLRGAALHQQMMLDALTVTPILLQHHPGVAIESLRFSTSEGTTVGDFGLSLPGDPPPGFLADWQLLLPALALHWQLQIPKPLAERWVERWAQQQLGFSATPSTVEELTQETLRRLRANRLLVAREDEYISQLEYAAGNLNVAGQTMNLPVF